MAPTDTNYPSDALHIWAENVPVDQHNNEHLQQLPAPEHIPTPTTLT
jgi:hypothetical protein